MYFGYSCEFGNSTVEINSTISAITTFGADAHIHLQFDEKHKYTHFILWFHFTIGEMRPITFE